MNVLQYGYGDNLRCTENIIVADFFYLIYRVLKPDRKYPIIFGRLIMINKCFLLYCILLLASQKLLAQAPVINSFSPKAGAVGTIFIVKGQNLKDSASIKIGSVPALILSNTGTKLTAMVMPGT